MSSYRADNEKPGEVVHPLTQTVVPTLTESSISTEGDAPLVAMKQPSPQGLEVLLLVTTTIMESTTYVVGTGSPSLARGGGGTTGVLPPWT